MKKHLQLYIVISLIYLGCIVLGKENLAWYFKPLLLPCLLLATNQSDSFPTKKTLLLALTFSWIGDVILMFADYGEIYFILGLVSFLIAHIFFLQLFIKQPTIRKPKTIYFAGAVFMVALYLFCMLFVLFPSLGDLKIPVSIYAFTISLMLAMAIRGSLAWQKPMHSIILLGAISFVISDSILAMNKFYTALPNASLWIMSTYIIAQYFITVGILQLHKKS